MITSTEVAVKTEHRRIGSKIMHHTLLPDSTVLTQGNGV
jgi:hypothetical protein